MTVLKTILTQAAALYNAEHDVKLKKLSEYGDYNLGAGIYRDPVTKEFVTFFVDGGEYLSKADSHTTDTDDAEGTVQMFLNPHKGEPLTEDKPGWDKVDTSVEVDDGTNVAGEPGEGKGTIVATPVRSRPRGHYKHPSLLLKGLLMRSPVLNK